MRTVSSSRRKAFSLVEVILAVGVLSMALLALVGLLGSSFQQVNNVVDTNRALSVVNYMTAAFDNPELIGGTEKIPGVQDKSQPVFNALYAELSQAVEDKRKTFYCFTRYTDPDKPEKGVLTVIVKMAGDKIDRAFYDENNGVGSVFRIEASVSNILEGQRIVLDSATYEPREDVYSGGALPPVETYALAYLPVLLEIYPHDIDLDITLAQQRDMKPILSQNVVINR